MFGTGQKEDILRYSNTLDKIDKVSLLSTPNQGVLALQTSDGQSIYYFGGDSNNTLVHKFNSETHVSVRLPTAIPSQVETASAVPINGTIFIFNRHQRNILEFNQK
jgi:hypothetical protein